MIAPLFFSPCVTLKHTKSISLANLLSMTYPKIFAQQPGETSYDYTPCFLTAAAAAPPSASHPRRPRLDGAALRGSGRPCRRGWAADLCGGHGGRGQQKRPWPWKGFRVVSGVALARWRKGFVHGQGIFVLRSGMLSGTCCLRIYLCDGMDLLKFGCKKWWIAWKAS